MLKLGEDCIEEDEVGIKCIKGVPTFFYIKQNAIVLEKIELSPGQDLRFRQLIEEIWGVEIGKPRDRNARL